MFENKHLPTICAISSPTGQGAVAVIRVSGNDAIGICNKIFNKNIALAQPKTLIYGKILKQNNEILDEVLLAVYKSPASFTGEDTVEIFCHGSIYIQQEILKLLLANGCQTASPGEYTMRAFLNGKLDLSQAEAIADLVASSSAGAHKLAMQQMRGGFSKEINALREELINFASLVELELDFSEEDVEFADRNELIKLIDKINTLIKKLSDSFALGNVIKNGVPVAIVGVPNVGKSTLLNALLNEDKAIVSDIPGTTRDAIEDTTNINGIVFRFIDTAGIRETNDLIENIGIEKTWKKIDEAAVILYVFDVRDIQDNKFHESYRKLKNKILSENKYLVALANKCDLIYPDQPLVNNEINPLIGISAKNNVGISQIKELLFNYAQKRMQNSGDIIVTNARHHQLLNNAWQALNRAKNGFLEKLPADIIAIDIRQAIRELSSITGSISTDDLLSSIFSRFCIGK
jgi:tRNA modification GTPase